MWAATLIWDTWRGSSSGFSGPDPEEAREIRAEPLIGSRFQTNLLRDIGSLIVSLNRTSAVVSRLVKTWAKTQVRNYSKQIIESYNEAYSRFDAIDCSDDSILNDPHSSISNVL